MGGRGRHEPAFASELPSAKGRNIIKAMIRFLVVLATAVVLSALAAAPASATQCGSMKTVNGATAQYINVTPGIGCPLGQRVALRAKGQRVYNAAGYRCRRSVSKVTSSTFYSCTKGSKGIGFQYLPKSR